MHGKNMRRQDRKAKELELRLKELDEIEETEEEKRAEEQESEIFNKALALGEKQIDPECTVPVENLFTGLVSEHETVEEECLLDEATKSLAIRTFTEERRRLDIDVRVSSIILVVEKAEVMGRDGEKTIMSASTAEHGPVGMNVTWNFLSQMSILVGQFGMPMTRLATLVSTPDHVIRSERIVRYFHYVARRLADIYLHSYHELANSAVLAGDDTVTRTLEVTRAFKNPNHPLPWESYATTERAIKSLEGEKEASLSVLVGSKINFVSLKKDTTSAPKKQFNTTIVHGRIDANDSKSTVVFFKSHFGSFGDLVSQMLLHRKAENKELSIVSDLSTTNGVCSAEFKITQAGCSAHARRKFKKADDGDVNFRDLCIFIFNVLYSNEECLDLAGRNKQNVLAVRQQCSKKNWDKLKDESEYIASKSSSSTSLGAAARYILNNFGALTAHLDDHRLPHTNDLSERLLRAEKQIQAASLFRNTIEGRVALDIIRSIIQTCSAAGTHAASYIEWVLRSDPEDVKARPQNYTPYAKIKAE
jgi:hypothetical protein